jgi:hypothetical protein
LNKAQYKIVSRAASSVSPPVEEDDMRRSQRFLVHIGLLIVMLLVITAAWSPATLAHEEDGTPVAETGTTCGTATMSLPEEELPEGVVRELLVTSGIDTSASASQNKLAGVASVVCITADTEVIVGSDGGQDTAEFAQDYTVTLVVLEGELELKVVAACAEPANGGTCATTGQADFRTADDYANPVAIGTDWTTISAGSIVVLADVTISMRTTDSAVRMLSTGIAIDLPGGGACPSSCANWRNP